MVITNDTVRLLAERLARTAPATNLGRAELFRHADQIRDGRRQVSQADGLAHHFWRLATRRQADQQRHMDFGAIKTSPCSKRPCSPSSSPWSEVTITRVFSSTPRRSNV